MSVLSGRFLQQGGHFFVTLTGWLDAPPAVGPAPLLGQHSGNVRTDWLKMDDVEIGQLRDANVIAAIARRRRLLRNGARRLAWRRVCSGDSERGSVAA
jgi:hypothetical protein